MRQRLYALLIDSRAKAPISQGPYGRNVKLQFPNIVELPVVT